MNELKKIMKENTSNTTCYVKRLQYTKNNIKRGNKENKNVEKNLDFRRESNFGSDVQLEQSIMTH